MIEPGITPEDFRSALGAFPTGVTVITSIGENGPSGATANAVTSLSLEPPMMLACLDRGSRTLASIRAHGRFGINVLAASQEGLARSFSGKQDVLGKWQGVDWSDQHGVPRLDGIVLWVACELAAEADGGDHVILTGDVIDAGATEHEPLVFWRGAYRSPR